VTVEQAVLDHLVADGDVAALVGTRVYQLVLPQGGTLPAVRVQLIDEPVDYHLRGEVDITRARVQVDAYAGEASGVDPYSGATALGEAIHAALSGMKFSVGSPALEVTGVFRQNREVLYEAEELRLVRVLQDYWVWSRTVN
jgi:hypothetical protein